MFRPPSDKLARKALLLTVLASAALGINTSRPVALDFAFGRTSSHALVQLGFASFRLAFDSGQECSKPDSCAQGVL